MNHQKNLKGQDKDKERFEGEMEENKDDNDKLNKE